MLNLIDTLKRTNEDMQGKLSELVHVQQQVRCAPAYVDPQHALQLAERNKEVAHLKAELQRMQDERKALEQEKKLLADTITGLIGSSPNVRLQH